MRIAFIADGRSENFRRMLRFFGTTTDELLILSTYPCTEDGLDGRLELLPTLVTAGDGLVKSSNVQKTQETGMGIINGYRFGKIVYPIWQNIKLLNIVPQGIATRRALDRFRPDVVVAFRTQNEGYVAAMAGYHPWVLFAQGSDFNYLARNYPVHKLFTRLALFRTNGLISDCNRDIVLAKQLGLSAHRPTHVMPGNGGVDLDVYRPGLPAEERERIIVCPRGVAPYIRLDTLLAAVDLIQDQKTMQLVLLIQPAMVSLVEREVAKHRFPDDLVSVRSFLRQTELASLLQKASAIVSPSMTDGTPNSMLEAMACGALPIMSDLDSIREWVQHGKNGLLFDPNQPDQLAECMMLSLEDVEMRQHAQEYNRRLIRERADYFVTMPDARKFLRDIAGIVH